jgi:hypothetical protein
VYVARLLLHSDTKILLCVEYHLLHVLMDIELGTNGSLGRIQTSIRDIVPFWYREGTAVENTPVNTAHTRIFMGKLHLVQGRTT